MIKAELSLEDMLLMIADHNRIIQYNFVIYEAMPSDSDWFTIMGMGYDYIDPEEGMVKYASINARELKSELDKLKAEALKDDYLVGITSKVIAQNREDLHLVLLDFIWEIEEDNLDEISNAVRELEITPGFVLESGRSYHFYSSRLADKERWLEVLSTAEEYPMVDSNWAGLQQRRGHSVLRVSTNSKKRAIPKVVEAIGYHLVNPEQRYLFEEFKPRWLIEIIT